MKKGTLADKISSLLTTTPTEIDPEDAYRDDTTAKLNTEYSQESEDEYDQNSKFRKDNIDLLADVDERYAGQSGSRKKLNSKDDFNEFSESDNLEESEPGSSDENQEDIDKNDSTESDVSNDDSGLSQSDEEYHDNSDNAELEDTSNFRTLIDSDVSSQVKKGSCVKNQMHIWENLLEMRIQVQKCLLAANKMPNHEKYRDLKKQFGSDFTAAAHKTKESLSTLLDKLLYLQDLAWKKFPETKKHLANKHTDIDDPDNEEIPSDTEDEANSDLSDEESPKKRLKLSDFERDLQTKHNLYKGYRNSVIKKWHEKTRIQVLKNSTNPHSIIDHIEHTLGDKDRLIKRTRLKRSDYKIIGEESESEKEDSTEDVKQEKHVEEYNSEIFDDDDFYHQLLRELIEFKSSSLTDPVQLGRQWVQLQNLRSKMKRKIDTKATKGRKIRYAVHTKLVNYMAPIDENTWTDEAKTELFGSLFGKTQAISL